MRISRSKTSPPRTRTGFTAAELTIGMIVTTLVASAAAALMLAVSQGWTHTEKVAMSQVSIHAAPAADFALVTVTVTKPNGEAIKVSQLVTRSAIVR